MKLSLVVLTPGKTLGKVIPISQPQFLIGRDAQCQMRPASPLISKRHCALIFRGDEVFVRDFNSTNGTLVNDEKVEGERRLNHEDKLTIGPLTLGIVLETGSTPVNMPTPMPPTRSAAHHPDEEAAADLLLALQDEPSTVQETPGSSEQEMPAGSTILDSLTAAADPASENGRPAATKLEQIKKAQADTSSAAQRILDKYIRRPRV